MKDLSTFGTGKWHQGMFHEAYLPTSRGFDKFVGSYSGSSQHTTHETHHTTKLDWEQRSCSETSPLDVGDV